jgi:hypothetical protein
MNDFASHVDLNMPVDLVDLMDIAEARSETRDAQSVDHIDQLGNMLDYCVRWDPSYELDSRWMVRAYRTHVLIDQVDNQWAYDELLAGYARTTDPLPRLAVQSATVLIPDEFR